MKAILIKNDEKRSLVWTDVPEPVMAEDECLIRIEAAGINRAGLMRREGNDPPPSG